MWEWRVFYRNADARIIPETLASMEQLHSRAPEHRTDVYYHLFDPHVGLKERGSTGNEDRLSRLELKLQSEKEPWGGELWSKIIKRLIRDHYTLETGLPLQETIKILAVTRQFSEQSAPALTDVIERLQTGKIPRIPIKKEQYQQEINQELAGRKNRIYIAKTSLEIQQQHWFSLAIECADGLFLKALIQKYLNPKNVLLMGYPEFLTYSVETSLY